MYNNHREFIENILFNYYMISSVRENEVFCPIAYNIDKSYLDKMKSYGETLDKLAFKIIKGINDEHISFKNYLGDFKYKEEILSLACEIAPIFWTRYDSFIRSDKGIFFPEFNYDKPCAQRETLVSSDLKPINNPNEAFGLEFKRNFQQIVKDKFKNESIVTAVLIDPCHYEEHHLAHLFMDLLQEEKLEVIAVGPKNLYVENEEVYAFGKKLQVILRLFPTEYLYEVNDFLNILDCFNKGNVLILNDPRVIIAQAKSLFAYLWKLVNIQSELLSIEETNAITEALPYTEMFNKSMKEKLLSEKDKYVIKAVFGRYSEEVYIGKLCNFEEWENVIEYVSASEKLHIVQEFCRIKKDIASKAIDMDKYKQIEAYGNFGIYMMNGDFKGVSVRWSENYLTSDTTTWITPVGTIEKNFRIESYREEDRKAKWKKVYQRAMEDYEFTGGYTYVYEYFSLDSLIIKRKLEEEIKYASEKLAAIFEKVRNLILQHSEVFFPILGIDDKLTDIIKGMYTKKLCAIGRMDWVVNKEGMLKLLEFNCETPAGIVEAIGLNTIIKEEIKVPFDNPNKKLQKAIVDNFHSIIKDFEQIKEIKNIAFLTSTYYEDWYNTKILMDSLKELPYDFTIGNIYDGKIVEGKLWLYGKPIDAVYRYYPLDWFQKNEIADYLEAFKKETLSINPPHTFVIQNKAFYALVFELINGGFFDAEEEYIINKYIPKTALSIEKLNLRDYCMKPFLGREGEGIKFNYEIESLTEDEYIYQEKIYIDSVNLNRYSAIETYEEVKFPVIGAYIVDNKYAGIYTRAGDLVTDRWAVYLPTYIEI